MRFLSKFLVGPLVSLLLGINCVCVGSGCSTFRVYFGSDHPSFEGSCPNTVLSDFLLFALDKDFEAALELLSADLRLRYDADTLKEDYLKVEDLEEDLLMIRQRLEREGLVVSKSNDKAILPLGAGRSVRLILENNRWKVHSLH